MITEDNSETGIRCPSEHFHKKVGGQNLNWVGYFSQETEFARNLIAEPFKYALHFQKIATGNNIIYWTFAGYLFTLNIIEIAVWKTNSITKITLNQLKYVEFTNSAITS